MLDTQGVGLGTRPSAGNIWQDIDGADMVLVDQGSALKVPAILRPVSG